MVNGISNNTVNNSINNINYTAGGKIDEKNLSDAQVKQLKKSGKIECSTCKSRRYKDGSDDSGVSYQTPTHISKNQSANKVMAHEMEHYRRETAAAKRNGEKILSIGVSTKKAVCPECGSTYTAGGVTRVSKRKDAQKESENAHFRNKAFEEKIGKHFGKEVDTSL